MMSYMNDFSKKTSSNTCILLDMITDVLFNIRGRGTILGTLPSSWALPEAVWIFSLTAWGPLEAKGGRGRVLIAESSAYSIGVGGILGDAAVVVYVVGGRHVHTDALVVAVCGADAAGGRHVDVGTRTLMSPDSHRLTKGGNVSRHPGPFNPSASGPPSRCWALFEASLFVFRYSLWPLSTCH